MRIVVLSDSHKRSDLIEKILYSQETAKHVFFLGDHADDIEDLQYLFDDKKFYILSGNCDYYSSFPSSAIATIGGKKIFYTHGHTLSVKHGTEKLLANAKAGGYDIVLYGHTHISNILYEDGIYIVNPGSLGQPRDFNRSYAVIDIEPNGIMPFIVKI